MRVGSKSSLSVVLQIFGFSSCDISVVSVQFCSHQFLPRCMQCRCGIAMRILSVRLSVSPSHA